MLLLTATLMFAPSMASPSGGATDVSAPAASRTRVGILPLAIDGNPPKDASERLAGRVRLALQSEDVELVDVGTRQEARDAGVDAVVQAEVTIEGRDYFVRVTLLTPDGKLRHESEATCEICTHAEGAEALGFEVAALRARLTESSAEASVTESSPPVIMIQTRPPGALVSLDGEGRGSTPFESQTTPGQHQIEVTKRGFHPEHSRIDAVAGGRHSVTLNLRDRKARPMRVGGWAAVGVSVPLLLSGVTLMALDERPFRRNCTGDDVDALGNCRFRYATLEGGIALTAIGFASAAAGVALLVLDRKRNPNRVSAAIGPRGLTVRGRF